MLTLVLTVPSSCCVCSHPQAADIKRELAQHTTPVTQLARDHSLSRDSLNFCRRRHLVSAPPLPAQPLHPNARANIARNREAERKGTLTRARERYLEVYAQCGNVSTSCKAAGIGRTTVYTWLEHDETFALAMKQADIQATESLEREAWRRARDGVAEPVYQHGKQVGTIQRYSDALLVFLLKARAPERYRDRVDVSVTPVIKAVAGFDPASVV